MEGTWNSVWVRVLTVLESFGAKDGIRWTPTTSASYGLRVNTALCTVYAPATEAAERSWARAHRGHLPPAGYRQFLRECSNGAWFFDVLELYGYRSGPLRSARDLDMPNLLGLSTSSPYIEWVVAGYGDGSRVVLRVDGRCDRVADPESRQVIGPEWASLQAFVIDEVERLAAEFDVVTRRQLVPSPLPPLPHLGQGENFAVGGPVVPSDPAQLVNAPPEYVAGRQNLGFDVVELGVGGIEMFDLAALAAEQRGYSVDSGWPADWLVIGVELVCGDPLIMSMMEPWPVFTAAHGEGQWDTQRVAPSIDTFWDCLRALHQLSSTDADQLPAAKQNCIGRLLVLCAGDSEAARFWIDQADSDF